ncbi:hypothetical protein EYF80_036741 [Liparis tanakae]|uniref:Uncharacterized protein n=1 Tax=Liparis tanakae TaxID=230148 RepID=A0A4Z2GHM4_9TELE|nr:hypothetical protein EYF80_036741 [Liparis tanakae]
MQVKKPLKHEERSKRSASLTFGSRCRLTVTSLQRAPDEPERPAEARSRRAVGHMTRGGGAATKRK